MREVWPGEPFPLGAHWSGEGASFSLFSAHAHGVELCLFDDDDREERIPLEQRSQLHWHGYLPGVGPGQRYGYRVHGPWAPEQGHRFNPSKLLIDPYARAIEGPIAWERGRTHGYIPGDDTVADDSDDAAAIPKCVVVDESFDWEGDEPPRRPWHETVIYELHVKGFTQRLPEVREDLRGTFAGLAAEEATSYLASLGVTAVELLPIHQIADENFLFERGQTNYWGYSTIGFFAPHAGYAATGTRGEQVREFKGMVKALHRAGLEVILDVVYNHTAEGSQLGPTLAFKGIDNRSYYRTAPDDPRHYLDFTGTGNTVDSVNPAALRLILDSLRYFVLDCHVDGFRFDLASALARERSDFDRRSSFLDAIHQDPVLSGVKLIAEPWDLGAGGFQVGGFPLPWSEWNARYRDTIRDFWRGAAGVAAFAQRFTGSSDLYQADGRAPSASINFVTAHDGFTLRDLVSYDRKHNEANGEGNRDGTDDNRSWNCGVEGPTGDPTVNALRARQQRNLLATLLLSQGVPMLLGGDELGRSQGGNNNAYCQDNELSWLDWQLSDEQRALLAFTHRLLDLRARHPVFRRREFLTGAGRMGSGSPDVHWFRPDGRRMAQRNWGEGEPATLGVILNGAELPLADRPGSPVLDDTFAILFNATAEPVAFRLPPASFGRRWAHELSTAKPELPSGQDVLTARSAVTLESRSLCLLRRLV